MRFAPRIRDFCSTWVFRPFLFPLVSRGADVGEYVRSCRKSQYEDPQAVHQYQLDRLKALILHCRRHVPWYRKAYERLDLPDTFPERIEDLQALPFMTRTALQEDPRAFVSELTSASRLTTMATGGSTGAPVAFCSSRVENWRRTASVLLADGMVGYTVGQRMALLWGAPTETERRTMSRRAKLAEWFWNRDIYNCYSVNKDTWQSYHRRLTDWRPDLLVCYAGAAAAFARYLNDNGIRPDYPRSGVICSAETLTDQDRRQIEGTFPADVYNRYGCRELGSIACECKYHCGLHTFPWAHLVEVVDPDSGKPVTDGEGELVITSLCNQDVPWIRYRIGDWGSVVPASECRCGRTTPRIVSLRGRIMDALYATNGNRIHGATLNPILWGIKGLSAYQIEQVALTRLLVRIKPGPRFDGEDLSTAEAEIKSVMGQDCSVDFQLVEEIPLSASGKRRFVINRLGEVG